MAQADFMTERNTQTSRRERGGRKYSALLLGLLLLGLIAIYVAKRPSPPSLEPEPDPTIRTTLDRLAITTAMITADEKELSALRRSETPAAHESQMQKLEARLRDHNAEAEQAWRDLGALLEISAPTPEASDLIHFPSQTVARYNYNQIYHPIEGPQPHKMPGAFSFRFDRVIPQADGSLHFRIDAKAGAAIKWEKEKKRARTEGHYILEATIDRIHPGTVYAPLWLYSEGAPENKHEFDFELMQGRIEYNLHNGHGGYHMRKVEKDVTGHRMRYEIIRRPDHVTMRVTSLTDGWSDELVITPEKVAVWAKDEYAPANLHLPPNNIAMFPLTEVWRCRWPHWCGEWQPLPKGTDINMIVHGYRIDP